MLLVYCEVILSFEDDDRYSSFGPEGDPIKPDVSFITTRDDKSNIENYKRSGSLLRTKMLDDARNDFLDAVDDVVSPNEAAEKLKELMNAQNKVTIESPDGTREVIKSPDYKTQMKAFDVYADIKGLRAPVKSVSAKVEGTVADFSFLLPESNVETFPPAKVVDEGAEYAAKRIEEANGSARELLPGVGSEHNSAGDTPGPESEQ